MNDFYDFTPNAFDPDGDTLRFQVTGKPSWASFNANTGRLYGAPPDGTAGNFNGIQIAVTDGSATVSLPTFSVLVLAAAQVVSGPAVLTWSAPTVNTDGSTLKDLAGYRIYYGTSPTSLTSIVTITNPTTTQASIASLAPGTWYFAIASYTSGGSESSRTSTVSVVIG